MPIRGMRAVRWRHGGRSVRRCRTNRAEPGVYGPRRCRHGVARRRGGVLTVDWRGSEAQPGGTRSARSPH